MNLFSVLTSLADGTLVDDAINGLEKGVETLESWADDGSSKLESVVDAADGALQSVIDGAEKAAAMSDIVAKKLE